ncbi:Phosphomannomutase [Methylorubrum aminovorans]
MANGGSRAVLIGRDLRDSSPVIAATVAGAATAVGLTAVDCGTLPTPALALEAMRREACAVMVTGSHIPEDRNGLKFYRPEGEITKADEAAILAALNDGAIVPQLPTAMSTSPESGALERYLQRYREVFSSDVLRDARIVVYQQSSVARDLMADLLTGFGASVTLIGRSDNFVPIDTEAHRAEDVTFIRNVMASGDFDALVTTDGDADRPLVADDAGRIVRGDVLGLITARYLGADAVVVPVTAGSALERIGGFRQVIRTKVGSPFVVAGMEQAERTGARVVVGFEANGGFLLGSNVTLNGKLLPALPTRDAMLPILATLATVQTADTSLSHLVASINSGEMASDRLPNIPPERSGGFLGQLADGKFRAEFLRPVGSPLAVDEQDGIKITLDGERTIHFRASGNAPELRCYVEANSAQAAENLVRWSLAAASATMSKLKISN